PWTSAVPPGDAASGTASSATLRRATARPCSFAWASPRRQGHARSGVASTRSSPSAKASAPAGAEALADGEDLVDATPDRACPWRLGEAHAKEHGLAVARRSVAELAVPLAASPGGTALVHG